MRKGKKILFNLFLAACIVTVLFSLWKIWNYYHSYREGEKEYMHLKDYVKKEEDSKREQHHRKEENNCPITVDFDGLYQINEDIIGWIYIPGTEINYPIVQGKDNSYYLHHTFENKKNFTGAIFMDILCQKDFSSDNTILYGHNMKNGSMFGLLKKIYDTDYNANADYKNHKIIWILTPKESRQYDLFCAREVDIKKDIDTYTVEFASREDYGKYLQKEWKYSLYQIDGCPDAYQNILTLSTCTSDEEERFIVQAVLANSTH